MKYVLDLLQSNVMNCTPPSVLIIYKDFLHLPQNFQLGHIFYLLQRFSHCVRFWQGLRQHPLSLMWHKKIYTFKTNITDTKNSKLKDTIAFGYQRIVRFRKLKLNYEKRMPLLLKKSLILKVKHYNCSRASNFHSFG